MSKYYRFISEAEYQTLITKGFVESKNNSPLFILSENTTAYILPEKLNYNLTIEELLASKYNRKIYFTKKKMFMSYMIGTVSSDYLIELDLTKPPSMSNLGWYGYDDNNELCIIEYCIPKYMINHVKNVYVGDFYNWKNIEIMTFRQ